MKRSGKIFFWSIKKSNVAFSKFKLRGFLATSLSAHDFSTLYTTLQHNLIKEKLKNLIECSFQREGLLFLSCNERNAFFTSEHQNRYKSWSYQNMCEDLTKHFNNIFIKFGTKLYRKIVVIVGDGY